MLQCKNQSHVEICSSNLPLKEKLPAGAKANDCSVLVKNKVTQNNKASFSDQNISLRQPNFVMASVANTFSFVTKKGIAYAPNQSTMFKFYP